jgi:hypothetical protein
MNFRNPPNPPYQRGARGISEICCQFTPKFISKRLRDIFDHLTNIIIFIQMDGRKPETEPLPKE